MVRSGVRPSVARRSPGGNGARRQGLSAAVGPVLAALVALVAPGRAASASAAPFVPARAAEPDVRPTLPWLAAQAVPSAEWLIADDGLRFGARWQVTPFLYSFGIDPRLSPVRILVAEPIMRFSGSVELYVSPAYLAGGGSIGERWLLRGGLRAYLPLLHRGEYLAWSIGGAAVYHRDRPGVSYEAGLYTLFGMLGVQAAYIPTPGLRAASLTLHVRVF